MPKLPVEPETKRRFLGKTENFSSKEEQAHEKKHLKAYLKGAKRFKSYKWDNTLLRNKLSWYPVLEELNGEFVDNSIYCKEEKPLDLKLEEELQS